MVYFGCPTPVTLRLKGQEYAVVGEEFTMVFYKMGTEWRWKSI